MGRMWAALAAAIGLGLLAQPAAARDASPMAAPESDAEAAAPPTAPSAAAAAYTSATRADWLAKPSGDDLADAYPHLAETLGVAGHVMLSCKVMTTGRLDDCRVESETPQGWGFGAAALKVAPLFRMAPATAGGSATTSQVRIPIRFALPKPYASKGTSADAAQADKATDDPAQALAVLQVFAVAMLALIAIPLLAALNDHLRRRRARTARIGAALERGFALVGPTLKRAPIPLLIYAALTALLQAVGPVPGPTPDLAALGRTMLAMPLVLAGAVLAYGGAYRVAFQGRGDPAFRIRNLGLQVGAVEGRLVSAVLLQLILVLVGWVALAILAILSALGARAAFGAATPPAALAAGPCLLLIAGALASARLSTFMAAWIAEGGERLGASWRATRACLLPPMMVGLVLVILSAVVAGGLVYPARVLLEGLAPWVAQVGAGVVYGVLAALTVPIHVGAAAYFYEALQTPVATTETTPG